MEVLRERETGDNRSLLSRAARYYLAPRAREKPGSEPEEAKLQSASRQIVQNAILQAVHQVSREARRREARTSDGRGSRQPGVGELTKKHEKK
ncbi:hypothetical protein CB1_000932002 [Camelus ferus]|nr:hypothetical protein CB1_000932002 [Camelus ferus]